MRLLRSGLDGACGGLDVLALAAGERGDAGAFDLAGDGVDGVEVAVGGDGESRLRGCRRRARRAGGPCGAFLSWCMVQPGDCSPSRRVVSKKTIWFGVAIGFLSLSIWKYHNAGL